MASNRSDLAQPWGPEVWSGALSSVGSQEFDAYLDARGEMSSYRSGRRPMWFLAVVGVRVRVR